MIEMRIPEHEHVITYPEGCLKKRTKDYVLYNVEYLKEHFDQERDIIMNGGRHFCDLYVYDKQAKRIHRIGTERHDSLIVYPDGVRYYNLQNGDGGGTKDEPGSGYIILQTHHGHFAEDLGIIDEAHREEIEKFIRELEGEE